MDRILAGIETEYGLLVEDHGAEDQIDDAMALVRGYPGECLATWDYRHESPRADLRGFKVGHLQVDPEDAKFDQGRARPPEHEVRADRILPNGARFYNDHGHPEYSTPECWSTAELAMQDRAGHVAVLDAARAFEANTGRKTRIYKNNTDFHGASYGTHENYLVPRSLGFEALHSAVLPMLVARTVLCGSGKVGAETGATCTFQLSQRADFFVEPVNAETLFRRPVFNTRDEPHADRANWMRLHVISGDANMMLSATARKVGLVKLALSLAMIGEAPPWRLRDPVRAFQSVSRDESYEFRIELEDGSWTTAFELIESYLAAAEATFGLRAPHDALSPEGEAHLLIKECRDLLEGLRDCPDRLARKVDWAAKKAMLEQFMEAEGADWREPILRSFDLEYHNLDPEEGLFSALVQMGGVEEPPAEIELRERLSVPMERNRAWARSLAITKFRAHVITSCWHSITLTTRAGPLEIELPPDRDYPSQLADASNVEDFIGMIRGAA